MKKSIIKAACYDKSRFIERNIDKFNISDKFIFYEDYIELFKEHKEKQFDIIFLNIKDFRRVKDFRTSILNLDKKVLLFMITELIIINDLDDQIKKRVDSFIIASNINKKKNEYKKILEKFSKSLETKNRYKDSFFIEVENRRSSEKKLLILSKLLEEIPIGIIIVRLNGEIEYVNQKYLEMYGYTYEDLIGKKWWEIGIENKIKKIYTMLLEGKTWSGTFMSQRKNGDMFWKNSSFYAINDYDEKPLNYIGISEDITQKMEIERELIDAKEKAELGAKAKSVFLANMSHEIRTPLSAITMLADMLEEMNVDGEQGKMISLLKNSADTLLDIVNDVLDFSKLDAEKVILEKEEFEIRRFIKLKTDLLKLIAEEKEIFLDVKIDKRIPNIINGDSKRLGQVLNNLLGNAIKFTSEGGVNLDVVLIDQTQRSVFIEFIVKDTGIGISQDGIDHIFEEFYQVESSYTKKIKGTGLGLVIARKLVRMMGGEITVKSEEGKGSNFTFDVRLEKY